MHRYELVVIISPQVAEEELPDAVERLIRRPVEGQGGVCDEVNVWGRRKLAYPIKSNAEGNYVVTQVQLEPAKAKDLEQTFLIAEDVLRHLLVRVDE